MSGAGVPILDLHAVIDGEGATEKISAAGVHMTDTGYAALAEAVSAGIMERLAVG